MVSASIEKGKGDNYDIPRSEKTEENRGKKRRKIMKNRRLETKRLMKTMLGAGLVLMVLVMLSAVGSAVTPTFTSSSNVLEIDGFGALAVGGGINPADYQSGGLYDAGIVKWDQIPLSSFINVTGVGGYDTIVLFQVNNMNLNTADKTILVDFVKNGGKLVIWDADSGSTQLNPNNYSWLPTNLFFEVLGGREIFGAGILQITEENDLSSSNPFHPRFINTSALVADTDAASDANIVVSNGTDWCQDMFGQNEMPVSGSVHMYSILGGSAEKGFIVYSGLDWTSAGKDNPFFDPATGGQMRKMLRFELLVSHSSDLPCKAKVVPKGSVSGMKFNDTNFNTLNDGEPGLNGWTITLSNQSGIIATQLTSGNGNYNFTGLLPDNYTVGEVIQPGWLQVLPQCLSGPSLTGSCTYTINLNGENVVGKDFGNFQMGIISGEKFDDINGDGMKEPGEPGLPNWTINLRLGNVTYSTVTDNNGDYNFSELLVGTYIISESLQTGWIQTAPAVSSTGSEAHIVKILTSGINVTGQDFGNFKLGEIEGEKFNDVNGNGIKDPEDSNISGWQINIVGTDTLTNTSVNKTVTTGPSGHYHISGLTSGTYTVSEKLQNGWIQTAPNGGTYTTNITSGANLTGKDFGNFKLGKISGSKFEDLDANGIKDVSESGLAGWTITISGTDTITNTLVNMSTTTDINGDYNFSGLTAGTYTVKEILQNGWIQTAPKNGTYTVTITSGAVITGQDFGNFHKGKITGGGWISIKDDPKATFGIDGQYQDSNSLASGHVEYQDHKANLNIKSIQINTVATTLDKKKGTITGLAQVNGAGSYPFIVYVEDNGEPGKGTDVFKIFMPTYPYSNGAILNGGNIQIHE